MDLVTILGIVFGVRLVNYLLNKLPNSTPKTVSNRMSEGICPKCSRGGKWDGNKCERCGYDTKLAQTNPELLRHIQFFPNPNTMHDPKQLYDDKNNIPNVSGVYGWYFDSSLFDKLFDDASKADFAQNAIKIEIPWVPNKEYYLMYIGITERPLRERIYEDHLKQNSKGSTLRQSLSALLYDDIGLDPRKQLKDKEEKTKLNSWIFEHAIVAWITIDDPEPVETEFIKRYGKVLPLNIEKNDHNPWKEKLGILRAKWRTFG